MIAPLMPGDLATGTNDQTQDRDLSGPNAVLFAEAQVEMVKFNESMNRWMEP